MSKLKYYAWLSSKEQARVMRCGALFAGYVRDIPKPFLYLKDEGEERQYCVIRSLWGE